MGLGLAGFGVAPLLAGCGAPAAPPTPAPAAGAPAVAAAPAAPLAAPAPAPTAPGPAPTVAMPVAATAAPTATTAAAAAVTSDKPAAKQETTWLYKGQHTFWSPTRDGGTGMYMGELVFGGLLTMDEKTNPLPYAAESWKSSDDGLVWTFKIRNDLKFAPTGRPVKAIDIKKSFELIIPNMYDWEAPTYYFMVQVADAAKKKTFDTRWKQIGDVAQPSDIAGFVAKSDYELEIQLICP